VHDKKKSGKKKRGPGLAKSQKRRPKKKLEGGVWKMLKGGQNRSIEVTTPGNEKKGQDELLGEGRKERSLHIIEPEKCAQKKNF